MVLQLPQYQKDTVFNTICHAVIGQKMPPSLPVVEPTKFNVEDDDVFQIDSQFEYDSRLHITIFVGDEFLTA
jgi:hypothetical protein